MWDFDLDLLFLFYRKMKIGKPEKLELLVRMPKLDCRNVMWLGKDGKGWEGKGREGRLFGGNNLGVIFML